MQHKIQLQPYYYECGDHCCSEWGTDIYIDGKRLESCSQEADSIVEAVLKHFGIDCEVEVLESEDNSVEYDDYLESAEEDEDDGI